MKEKIDEIVKKVKDDPKFLDNFKKNPIKAVESVLGVDLPDDQINGIIEGVKAKINLDNLGGGLGKITSMFKK